MDLLPSNNNYLDCTYSHNSVPVYSTSTVRLKLFRRVTNVTKSTPGGSLSNQKNPRLLSGSQPATQRQSILSEQRNPIAQIRWNSLRSNKLVLCGQELKNKWIQTNPKSRPPGNEPVHDFQVTSPDGQLYKWGNPSDQTLTLISVSNPTNILARLETSRKPRAEILRIAPAGVDMADFIVLTFIYFKSSIEKNRVSGGEADVGTDDDDSASSESHREANEIVVKGGDLDLVKKCSPSNGEEACGGGVQNGHGYEQGNSGGGNVSMRKDRISWNIDGGKVGRRGDGNLGDARDGAGYMGVGEGVGEGFSSSGGYGGDYITGYSGVLGGALGDVGESNIGGYGESGDDGACGGGGGDCGGGDGGGGD